jgi:hypothetical protein
MIEMLIAFMLAWVCTITGVALGGFLVYRTKREHYEPFMTVGQPKGDSFNIDDGFSDEPIRSTAEIPRAVSEANDLFTQQFAESLATRAEGKK